MRSSYDKTIGRAPGEDALSACTIIHNVIIEIIIWGGGKGVGEKEFTDLNCPKEKSLASTACRPSLPLIPTPMWAAVGQSKNLIIMGNSGEMPLQSEHLLSFQHHLLHHQWPESLHLCSSSLNQPLVSIVQQDHESDDKLHYYYAPGKMYLL